MYTIQSEALFVEPVEMGLSFTNRCYLGVFQYDNGNNDLWILGNKMMEDYYLVFD